MSKGYLIATIAIRDQTGYDGYVQKAFPIILKAGGRPVIVHDNPEVIEGRWHGTRTIVLEFDSVEAARNMYKSAEYQAAMVERRNSAEVNAAIVSGLEMPTE